VGNTKANISKVDYSRRILIFQGKEEKINEEDLIITSLPHPKRGKNARFVISNKKVLEIQRLHEQPSSWFIDNTAEKDGSFYLCTPVDPLFLLIRLLEQNRKKSSEHGGYFCEFSQMLFDTDQPGYAHFAKLTDTFDLSLICDINNDLEQPLCRLNDEKIIHWLRAKVENLRVKLAQSDHLYHAASQSSTFRLSSSEKKLTNVDILKGALGFVSEYVTPERMTELAKTYGIVNYGVPKLSALDGLHSRDKFIPVSNKREGDQVKQPTPKKQKPSLAQSKLAKTNIKGMNKMDSFFKKKADNK